MNENPMPGVTPTPTPEPTPTPQPTPTGMPEAAPVAPQPTPTFAPNSIPAPGQVETPVIPTTPSAAPTEPMPEAAPKKKTGLIIGVIATVLIVCGAIAAFLFLNSKKDPNTIVYNAFANLVADEKGTYENTAFDGSVSIGAMGMPLYDLSLNGGINKSAIELNLSLSSSMLLEGLNVNAGLIANENSIFAKVEGISDLADTYGLGIDLSNLEGEWYKVDFDEITKYTESLNNSSIIKSKALTTKDEDVLDVDEYIDEQDDEEISKEVQECLANETKILNTKRGELLDIYESHKFMNATEYTGSDIAAKKDTLYAINLDKVKFAEFINAIIIDSNLFNGVFECLGTSARGIDPIEIDDLEDVEIPTIYVEINNREEFTRFYLPLETEDGMELTVDFSIDHPAKVEILEPTNAKSIEDLMEELMPKQSKTTKNKKYSIQ